jgi:tRNA G18 (ribose-2'-O)-methylase SpoU
MVLSKTQDYSKDFDPELDSRNLVDKFKGKSNAYVKEELARNAFNYSIAIENYQHDFNIGTIVRNANAFNCKGVHIIGKKQWNRRGAMVTDKYLQIFQHSTIDEFKKWADENKVPIVGVDNIADSKPITKYQYAKSCVLVFGQEGPGLSKEMQKICKDIIFIEQFGSTRSVNVGVASGIIMNDIVTKNFNKL